MLTNLEFKIEVTPKGDEIHLILPGRCSDVALRWNHAWQLGDVLGQTAHTMPNALIRLGMDEADAAVLGVKRVHDLYIVFHFPECTRIVLGKHPALIVAENICSAGEVIAKEQTEKEGMNLYNDVMKQRAKQRGWRG